MHKHRQRLLSVLLSLMMTLGLILSPTLSWAEESVPPPVDPGAEDQLPEEPPIPEEEMPEKPDPELLKMQDLLRDYVEELRDKLDEKVRIMVTPKAGFSLEDVHKEILALDPSNQLVNRFKLIQNMSFEVKRSQIDLIWHLPSVARVDEVPVFDLKMMTAVDMTQVRSVWQDYGYKGEGMVVAVLDTGVTASHPSMRLSDPSTAKLKEADVNALIQKHGLLGKYISPKIPYAYNYADYMTDVTDVEDPSPGSHGLHCAGIIAGNSPVPEGEPGSLKGVAPEAQILNMKVFALQGGGASADDCVMAIEEAILLGADVISMSLGSPGGIVNEFAAYGEVIKKATEVGILVVIANGNEGMSSSIDGNNVNTMGLKDSGIAGTPAVYPDALAVASVENTAYVAEVIKYSIAEQAPEHMQIGRQEFGKQIQDLPSDQAFEVVDCGFGVYDAENNIDDFQGKDLNGKVALIERGKISFEEKIMNAQARGAMAVIIFQNEADANRMMGFIVTKPDEVKIAAFSTLREPGLKLREALSKGQKVTVTFKLEIVSFDNPEAGQMSAFTSWGPTPSLKLKPEISAPGGMIYSSVDEKGGKVQYGNMSGTSMATPHVAGAAALLKQAHKKAGIQLGIRELKAVLMNTATVLSNAEDDSLPFSPRRQGSGLLQLGNAIKSRVYAIAADHNAYLTLGEFNGSTTASISLHNFGDKELSFKLAEAKVYTEKTERDAPAKVIALDGASVSMSSPEVKIAPGQTVDLSFTINAAGSENNFCEGYIKLNSTDPEQPAINIPFFGFNGAWGTAEGGGEIFTPLYKGFGGHHYMTGEGKYFKTLVEDKNILYWYPEFIAEHGMTALRTIMKDERGRAKSAIAGQGKYFLTTYELALSILGKEVAFILPNLLTPVEPETYAFSPNGDGDCDVIWPQLANLRGIDRLDIHVVDQSGNVLIQNFTGESYRSPSYYYVRRGRPGAINLSYGGWNGYLYNPATGYKDQKAEEGSYKFAVEAHVGQNSQLLEMPFKLDLTAPTVEAQKDYSNKPKPALYDKEKDKISLNVLVKDPDLADGSQGSGIDVRSFIVKLNGRQIIDKDLSAVYMDFGREPYYGISIDNASKYIGSNDHAEISVTVQDWAANRSEELIFDQIQGYDKLSDILYLKGEEIIQETEENTYPVSYNLVDQEAGLVTGSEGQYSVLMSVKKKDEQKIRVLFAGQEISPDANGQYAIPVANQGKHELSVEVLNADGTLKRTDKIIISLKLSIPEIEIVDPPQQIWNTAFPYIEVPADTRELELAGRVIDDSWAGSDYFIEWVLLPLNRQSQKESEASFGQIAVEEDKNFTAKIANENGSVAECILSMQLIDLNGNPTEQVLILITPEGKTPQEVLTERDHYIEFNEFDFWDWPRLYLNGSSNVQAFGNPDPLESKPEEEQTEAASEPETEAETTALEQSEASTETETSPEASQLEENEEAESEATESENVVTEPEENPAPSEDDPTAGLSPSQHGFAHFLTLETATLNDGLVEVPPMHAPNGLESGYLYKLTGSTKYTVTELSVNGKNIPLDSRGRFAFNIQIQRDYMNYFNVKVKTGDQEVVNTKMIVAYDPDAPEVKMSYDPVPKYDAKHSNIADPTVDYQQELTGTIWTNGDQVDIKLLAEVKEKAIESRVYINGNERVRKYDQSYSGYQYFEQGYSYEETVPTKVGEWLLVQIGDDSDQFYRERLLVKKDETAPIVTISRQPDQDKAKEEDQPNFSWEAHDPESDILRTIVVVERFVDGVWQPYEYTEGAALPAGKYRITVTAINYAGLQSSASSEIEVEGKPEEEKPETPEGIVFNYPAHFVYELNEDPRAILAGLTATKNGMPLSIEVEEPEKIDTSIPGHSGIAYLILRDPATGEIVGRYPFSYRVRNVVIVPQPDLADRNDTIRLPSYHFPSVLVADRYQKEEQAKASVTSSKTPSRPIPATGEKRWSPIWSLYLLTMAAALILLRRRK